MSSTVEKTIAIIRNAGLLIMRANLLYLFEGKVVVNFNKYSVSTSNPERTQIILA